jgi:hypothetical protein
MFYDKACPERSRMGSLSEQSLPRTSIWLKNNPCNQFNPWLKIGKNPADFQSKTLIPQNKNQNFQKIFNLLSQIDLRQSLIDIRRLFSHQNCRYLQL